MAAFSWLLSGSCFPKEPLQRPPGPGDCRNFLSGSGLWPAFPKNSRFIKNKHLKNSAFLLELNNIDNDHPGLSHIRSDGRLNPASL
jgi:hypothetical protein